jgi:hypothetical protein
MKATTDNWQDIKKYYAGTFILVPEVTNHVLHVEKVDQEYIYVSDHKGEKGGIELTKTGYVIKDILPYKQYFQISTNQAGIIARKPARMWKKGIHQENTYMAIVTEEGSQKPMTVTHSNLETFQQSKGEFKSFDAWKTTTKSMALSERFCLTADGKLFMDSFCIGVASPKKKMVLPMKEFVPYLPTQSLWEVKAV